MEASFETNAATVQGSTTGIGTAVHAGQHQVTLDHELIPEINWSAFRMELSVAQFVDLTEVKPGSRVQLTMGGAKGSYTVYSIRQPQQAQPSLEEVG